MKVLILSHSSELSGAEKSMIDLFDYWAKRGLVKPHFIIRRPLRNMPEELRKRKWEYTPLYYTNWSNRTVSRRAEDIYRNALFNTKAIFKIEKLINELKPDVVMTNTIVSPWAALAAYYQGVPHVWFVREYGDADHKHIFEVGRENMLEDIGTLSDIVVTNSRTLADDIKPHLKMNELTTLYTPFDIEKLTLFSQEKAKNPYKYNDSLKLVITGRIAPSKGQPEAAEAVGKLAKLGHNVELCIIGESSEPEDMELLNQTIEKYGISDRVHLLGKKDNPIKYVAMADVGITASFKEAFGRVTFEYMAIGKPVVGANSGATPEMVEDGKTGYLYKRGDSQTLVNQLLKYANDRAKIENHGLAAKLKAREMMNGEYNADKLYKKIESIVSGKRVSKKALNYSHRWLKYPSVADQYIKDSGVISLNRLLYHRLRYRAKLIYLWLFKLVGKDGKKV